jgi:flagellar protein FlbD
VPPLTRPSLANHEQHHRGEDTMINLHRLGQREETFHLNPDLIVSVEGNPDTVITLATGSKVVVAETPEQVAKRVGDFRVEVMSRAMARSGHERHGTRPGLHAVPLAADDGFEPL